ncbi:hypothetical protein DJ568_15825 [Mucilaginibacter hurinus]|uniref:Uncharacterized protein n=1 Tax=Mucilaginibacter hurinus TaxID=2201324 RepID=A0A367GLH6_9SPHI|nr:hypothetical protein [Mucilaginibacter hurinus]RCH53706.1 hypothetical protein DJ568_15825 [Mucilaginibacter hurinus]
MIKRLCYIIFILMLVPFLSFAATKKKHFHLILTDYNLGLRSVTQTRADTVINKRSKKQREEDEKNKIKEIAKAKKQLKPEKVTDNEDKSKKRRQRRPEGMERPPEIIRRNGG